MTALVFLFASYAPVSVPAKLLLVTIISVCTEKSKLTRMYPISPTDIDMLTNPGNYVTLSRVP